LVQGHECLCNLQHKDCDNSLVKDSYLKEIAGELNAQDKELRQRTQHCRRMAGSWQGIGMGGMVCVNRPLKRQGNGMVCVNRPLKWHGNGMVCVNRPLKRHGNGMVCVNRPLKRHGNGRGTAWERHGMCESAFKIAWEQHGICKSAFKTAWERHGMCESALRRLQQYPVEVTQISVAMLRLLQRQTRSCRRSVQCLQPRTVWLGSRSGIRLRYIDSAGGKQAL
jgi:hypothetical protein